MLSHCQLSAVSESESERVQYKKKKHPLFIVYCDITTASTIEIVAVIGSL